MIKDSNFLIVEDEYIIAETISDILKSVGCKSVRIADSTEDAIKQIEMLKPTMVLTDINLGKEKTGVDLGELLHSKFQIPFIYITSHTSPEILGKAKHTRPNAYIVKPFKDEDLLVAIELALFNTQESITANIESKEILIKEGRAMVRILCDSIKSLETDGNYVTINLHDGKRRVVRIPLSELQQQLPKTQFIRIHKSYIVNKKFVDEIRSSTIVIQKEELPIGRSYQEEVAAFFK